MIAEKFFNPIENTVETIAGRQVFRTTFINKSKETVRLLESGGKRLCDLLPNDSWDCVSTSPGTSYARWRKVEFDRDGKIHFTPNPTWEAPQPPGTWLTEFYNLDGAPIESITIFNNPTAIYRGFPRIVAIPPDNPWVFYSKVIWRRRVVERPNPQFPQYLEKIEEVVCDRELRPAKQLEEIRAAQAEAIKKNADREFKNTAWRLPREVQMALEEK